MAASAAQETVSVACKLPNGLVCEVVDMRDYMDQVQRAEGRPNVPIVRKTLGRFRLRGYQEARATDSAGMINVESRRVSHLFGITQNVPKDLWDAWWEQNKDCFAPAMNGLIFAHAQTKSVEAYAKEHAELKTGFDPIDPENPDGRPKDAKGLRIKPENYQGMPSMDD
jgi:hypothetical protein